jgi:hypothetical protein
VKVVKVVKDFSREGGLETRKNEEKLGKSYAEN